MGEASQVAKFYEGKSVLITGATGFLGISLVEKLLRSCPQVSKIYLLVRFKNGNHPRNRVNEILKGPLFETIRRINPRFSNKVEVIESDFMLPGLGISLHDEQNLINNVNIVFHLAAATNPEENLKIAVQVNVLGTKKILDICRKMPNLDVFLLASSAYANSNHRIIKESVYKLPAEPNKIINSVSWLSNEMADQITPSVIGGRPDTITYTKAVAEYLVLKECGHKIPSTIVRPSIVGTAWKEPNPGWMSNLNGLEKLFARIETRDNCTADIIPVDFCVNLMIVAAWERSCRTTKSSKITVYNHTTGQINRVTWKTLHDFGRESFYYKIQEFPSMPDMVVNSSVFPKMSLWEELLPPYVTDLYQAIFKKIKGRKKTDYLWSGEWKFNNQNLVNLNHKLNKKDNQTFYIDASQIDWKIYMENYLRGIQNQYVKERTPNSMDSNSTSNRLIWWAKDVGSLFIGVIFLKCVVFVILSFLVFTLRY